MKKLNFEKLVAGYIESKKESWSPSTLKSEGYRLRGVTVEMLTDAELLYKFLKVERELKPYPLKTAFIRAGEVVDYAMAKGLMPNGVNKIKLFMKDKANLFKNVYSKKTVDMSFEQAASKIAEIQDEASRAKAMQLLFTGMRFTESLSLEDGKVTGKGGWQREIPMAKDVPADDFSASHSTFYRHLKAVGLTPHMLRKLCATRLAAGGAQEADLMKIMGWRSSQMASLYVQAQRESELMALMKKDLDKVKQTKKGTSKHGK